MCVYERISLIIEPIRLSYTLYLLIDPGKVLAIYWEITMHHLPREKAPSKEIPKMFKVPAVAPLFYFV